MKCVLKRYMEAGEFVELREVPGQPDQLCVVYDTGNECRKVRLPRSGVEADPPSRGDMVIDGPLRVEWVTAEEFRQHYSEIA